MLINKTEIIAKRLRASNNVQAEIDANYKGIQYRTGIIENVAIDNIDTLILEPIISTEYIYTTCLKLQFTIFEVPVGFILPNARIEMMKTDTQNPMNIRFSCSLIDNTNKQLGVSNRIIPIITSDNKTGLQQKRFANLAIGDYVNIVCVNPIITNGTPIYSFSANIADAIKAIIFVARNIDISKFHFHANTSLASKLMSKHSNSLASHLDLPILHIDEGSTYIMTMNGFHQASELTVDFISDIIELTSDDEIRRIVGPTSLNEYLLAIANNWYFVINNNEKLQQGELTKLLQIQLGK